MVAMGEIGRRRQRHGLVGRAVRRHACQSHRRHRPYLSDRRNPRRLRRAPHRGADRASGARQRQQSRSRLPKPTASELRVPVDEMPARVAALLDERKQLERELSRGEEEARHGRRRRRRRRRWRCETSVASSSWREPSRASSSRICAALPTRARRSSAPASSLLSASPSDGKAGSSSASPTISSRVSTPSIWCASGAEALGGKGGGGRPDMAQGGGPDGAKADAALAAIEAALGA